MMRHQLLAPNGQGTIQADGRFRELLLLDVERGLARKEPNKVRMFRAEGLMMMILERLSERSAESSPSRHYD